MTTVRVWRKTAVYSVFYCALVYSTLKLLSHGFVDVQVFEGDFLTCPLGLAARPLLPPSLNIISLAMHHSLTLIIRPLLPVTPLAFKLNHYLYLSFCKSSVGPRAAHGPSHTTHLLARRTITLSPTPPPPPIIHLPTFTL